MRYDAHHKHEPTMRAVRVMGDHLGTTVFSAWQKIRQIRQNDSQTLPSSSSMPNSTLNTYNLNLEEAEMNQHAN